MDIQTINLGTLPRGEGGDSNREAFEKINANFQVLITGGGVSSTPPVSSAAGNALTLESDGLLVTLPFPAPPTNQNELPAALGVDETGAWVWHKIGC